MNGIGMLAFLLGIAAASSAAMGLIKKKVFSGIYGALNAGDYGLFFRKVDSKCARAVLPVYSRENMKLSAYIAQDDAALVAGQINSMMKHSMNSWQLTGLLVRGYDYFLQQMDGPKCGRILAKMEDVLTPEHLEKYRMNHDILFGGSTEHVGRLKKDLGGHRGRMKGYLEYLLARSYQNMGKQEACGAFLEEAAKEYKTDAAGIEKQLRVM